VTTACRAFSALGVLASAVAFAWALLWSP